MRVAFRSETGLARFNEGGCGGPGVPHPEAKTIINAGRHSPLAEVVRMNESAYQKLRSYEAESPIAHHLSPIA